MLFKITQHLEDGRFKLDFAGQEDWLARLALIQPWTAEELLRDFTMVDPNVRQTRYEQLIENAGEDADPV